MSQQATSTNGAWPHLEPQSSCRIRSSSGTTSIAGGSTVPNAKDAAAQAVIADAMADGAWDPSYGLNFALLHLSTAHAFLITGIWRGHQELWARHYVKDLATNGPFIRLDVMGQDAPFACVWELDVICHERMAWHRYLFSDRTDAAKRAWVEDVYQGQV